MQRAASSLSLWDRDSSPRAAGPASHLVPLWTSGFGQQPSFSLILSDPRDTQPFRRRLSLSAAHQTHTKWPLCQQLCFEPQFHPEPRKKSRYKLQMAISRSVSFKCSLILIFQTLGCADSAQMFPKSIFSMWRGQPEIRKSKEQSAAVRMEYRVILNLPLSLT